MDWGLENRLSHIFSPKTHKTVMLAVDHGYFLGPTTGLESPQKTIGPLIPYADSLMLNRGVLRNCVDPQVNVPIVLRVSGATSILSELSNEEIVVSIKEAVKLNASAMAVSIFIGAPYEKQTLLNLSRVINEASEYNLAVLAVTAVGKEMERDARYLSLCSRIAAELGAHMVKTYFCKDDFQKVVEACPVPIIIAGGKKIPEIEALQVAQQAIEQGARGVDMGRNIFQSENPVAMIQAVRKVVHEKVSSQEAYETIFLVQGHKKATKATEAKKATKVAG